MFETATIPGLTKFDESLKVYSAGRVVDIQFPSPFLKNAPTVVEEWCMEGDAYQERRTLASYQEAFKEELIHFHQCIVQGETPETTLAEAREDIALLIQIAEAAIRGTPLT